MIPGGEKSPQSERLDANHVASLRRYIAYRKEANARDDSAHSPVPVVEQPPVEGSHTTVLVAEPAALQEHQLQYEVQPELEHSSKSA